MIKMFLSLGFNKKTNNEVVDTINRAKETISKYYPGEVLEFVHNYNYMGNNRIECLGEAIKKMSACDIVYFINNWCEHSGCIIEHTVCEYYKIPYTSITV